jgi:hypothetical protein
MFTGFSAHALAIDRTPDVVGKVVNSSNATVEGSRLLANGTILSGDAVRVGEGGSLLLRYSPTGRAVLSASTQVRFSSAKGNIVAQLLAGTLAVERENKDAFVVKTSAYQVAPQGEGRAEYLVALLPDKRTIVESQHGRLAITETQSGKSYTLAEGLRAEIVASATGIPGQEKTEQSKVIGLIIDSTGATRNGKTLANGEWIADGDLVATGKGVRAIIQLLPTNLVTLEENTSTRFTRPVERVWLRLESGSLVVENTGESNVMIATARFQIEPTSAAPSRIRVEVGDNNSNYIHSVAGDVKIGDIQTGKAYFLPAGQDILIPPNASGVPGLKPIPGTPAAAPNPPPGTPPSTPSTTTPPTTPQSTSNPGSNSHTTLIILGIAAGGAIGGAAAALSGGGGHSSTVSPSSP